MYYFIEWLEQFKGKKVKLLVDMDGVIAHYDFGNPKDYDIKRPLRDNILKIEAATKMEDPIVIPYIFSATRYSEGYDQKNEWLDINAPFFKKENRIIISREENGFMDSSALKAEYLINFEREDDTVIVVIEDDPRNMKAIKEVNPDVILVKDTILVDDTIYNHLNAIETVYRTHNKSLGSIKK